MEIGNWTNEQLKAPMDAVDEGALAHAYGIPTTSPRDHVPRKHFLEDKVKKKVVLSPKEEKHLIESIMKMKH